MPSAHVADSIRTKLLENSKLKMATRQLYINTLGVKEMFVEEPLGKELSLMFPFKARPVFSQ